MHVRIHDTVKPKGTVWAVPYLCPSGVVDVGGLLVVGSGLVQTFGQYPRLQAKSQSAPYFRGSLSGAALALTPGEGARGDIEVSRLSARTSIYWAKPVSASIGA